MPADPVSPAAVTGTAAAADGPARGGFDPRVIAAAGAVTISLTAVLTKLADTTAATVVFYRCLLALPPLALLVYGEVRRHGWPRPRTLAIQVLGGIFLGLDFALWTQSIMMIGAGIATIINNVQVIVVPLLAWAFYRDRIPLRFVLAVPVMFIGIALAGGLVGQAPPETTDPVLGTLLGLASGVAYAGYIVVVGRTGSHLRANSQVFVSTVAAGVSGTALGLVWGSIDLNPGWGAIGWLALLALSAQVIGWVLLGASLPRLPAQVGAALLLLQPALALFFAMLLVDENPTGWQLAGSAVVIAAVWFVSRTPRRARPPATDTDTLPPQDAAATP